MKQEKSTTALSGYLAIFALMLTVAGAILGGILANQILLVTSIILALLIIKGLTIINPNDSKVLILFGEYIGTVKKDGFFWVNPFAIKHKVSLKARIKSAKPKVPKKQTKINSSCTILKYL